MKYILGIDAGSTKTKARITDENEKILGEGLGGSGNVLSLGPSKFKSAISDVINQAQRNSGQNIYKFDAFCFGGAGIDTPEAKLMAEKLLKEIAVADKLLVLNDTQIVLPACGSKSYGMVMIIGTGSNFYGKNKAGQEAYVGGLGELLADEGSAYWLGREALRAVIRANDRRGPQTSLTNLIFKNLFVNSISEMVNKIYSEDFEIKSGVAELAKIVDTAYAQKDNVASQIFEQAFADIILSLNTLTTKLHMQDEEFEIYGVGGVLKSQFPFEQKINEKLTAKKAKFIVCKQEPVEGAIKLAIASLQ